MRLIDSYKRCFLGYSCDLVSCLIRFTYCECMGFIGILNDVEGVPCFALQNDVPGLTGLAQGSLFLAKSLNIYNFEPTESLGWCYLATRECQICHGLAVDNLLASMVYG